MTVQPPNFRRRRSSQPPPALRLKAIRELPMRVAAAAQFLHSDPPLVVFTLAEWVRAVGGNPSGTESVALDAACLALSDAPSVSYQQRADLYRAAHEADDPITQLLFFDVDPDDSQSQLGKKAGAERPLTPNGRPLTLGERKSLARGSDRSLLGKLVRDPHPDVVAILLANPHLTESDALVIASARPALPETLRAVYLSERFRTRHPIKRALILNPHCPLPIAGRIAVTLRIKDLKEVAGDRSLPTRLRIHARSICSLWSG